MEVLEIVNRCLSSSGFLHNMRMKLLTKEEIKIIEKETNFLPQSSPLKERIYCIRKGIKEVQRCKLTT